MTLDAKLKQRGILAAAHAMHWQQDGNGWKYPVFSLSGEVLTHRWKNGDSAAPAGKKYLWKPNKPAGVQYYHAPDIRQAVAAAGGVLYIANGEPSVLAYHAAGIRNVLSWYGENSVPASLPADLLALDVCRVVYAPDNDDTGLNSAAKVRDLLAGSGIDFEAVSLAAYPAKADFNDVWKLCDFDAPVARNTLDALPALELPAPEAAPVQRPQRRDSTGTGRVDRVRLLEDVLAYFQKLPGWKRSGKGFAGRSPFREDRHGSAGITTQTGTYTDFATGEKLRLFEVAELAGFRLDDYRTAPARGALQSSGRLPKTPRQQQAGTQRASVTRTALAIVQRDESPCWNYAVKGLPDTWRSAALAVVDAGATFFLERLLSAIAAGDVSPEDFTAAYLADITGLSKSQVNRVLAKLLDAGVFIELNEAAHKIPIVAEDISYRHFVRRYCLQSFQRCKAQLLKAITKHSEIKYLSSDRVLPSLRRSVHDEEITLAGHEIQAAEAAIEALRTDSDWRAERLHRLDVARWQRELNDLRHTPIAAASSDDYRPALLKVYLSALPADARHHRHDTARYLGCKEGALKAVYKAAGMKPVSQWESIELQAITSAASLNKQQREAQKLTRGKVIHINSSAGVTYKGSAGDPAYIEALQEAQWRGEVLTFELRVPSLLVAIPPEEAAPDAAGSALPHTEETPNTPREADKSTAAEVLPDEWCSFAGRKIRVALHRLGFHVNSHGDIIHTATHDTAMYEVSLTDALRLIMERVQAVGEAA